LNTFAPDSRFARVIDLSLDLLMVLILLGAPLIFYTQANDVFEFNKLTAVRAFSALAACLYLAKLLFVRPLELTRSSTDIPVLAWMGACFVATFNTISLNLSLHGVYEDFEGITTLVNYVFLMYLMQQQIRSVRQIRMVIGAIIVAGTVAGYYGILQNVNIDFVPWNTATYSADRMFSTMGNPNFLAAYLVMSLPVCLVVFLDLPNRVRTDKGFCAVLIGLSVFVSAGLCVLFKANYFNFDPGYYEVGSLGGIFLTKKFWAMHILLAFPLVAAVLLYRGWLKILFLLSMIFQVVAVLFTKSRGAGVSLGVIVVLFTLYFLWDMKRDSEVLKRNKWWLASFAVLILLVHVLFPGVLDTTTHLFVRLLDIFSPSNFRLTPRLYIWRSALQIMRDHFFFGTGLDTFQIAFPQYRLALYWILEWNGTPEKAHNMVMQIAATMGLAGLLSFFWVLVAFVGRVFMDLKEQADSSRRLLIIGCFVGVAAFFAQNLFSFTVVGYGVTFWMLMGFLPAMQRTWRASEGAVGPGPSGAGLAPWRFGVGLISIMGLLCLLAGTYFHLKGEALYLRWVLALCGLVLLALILASKNPSRSPKLALGLLGLVGMGYFVFTVHSVRIWMADRFYKQGQVGIQVGNPAYAAMMYQKAAGRIDSMSADQERALLVAQAPRSEALKMTFTAGLNPDQELYWVKMGIAFENAAAAAQGADDKLRYFRTALAIHQLTLGMNPINGYNFNNKGRVLKAMGETFGRADFLQAALEHYKQAIALDANNVYFNMDYAQTQVDLGQWNEALAICKVQMERFPDYAMPYSYAGFIWQRQGKVAEAIPYFRQALPKDWKGDRNAMAMAATNLGILLGQTKGGDAEAQAAFDVALRVSPDTPEISMSAARLHLKAGRKAEAIRVLKAYQQRNSKHDGVNKILKELGA
jgi:O-antigen ligase/tetratricopeptide (TPR) repeat protein